MDFVEAANTPIPGGTVVNITGLMSLRTGEMEKCCKKWEDMKVGLKTSQAFKDRFSKAYIRYQISKKARAAGHGYGATVNHTQETDAQVNTADKLQTLACAAMGKKEVMANLTSINLTLSQCLTQSRETIMVLPKQLQALQTQANANTLTTEIPVLENSTKETKSKCYC